MNPERPSIFTSGALGNEPSEPEYTPGAAIQPRQMQEIQPQAPAAPEASHKDTADQFRNTLEILAHTTHNDPEIMERVNALIKALDHAAQYGTGAERDTLTEDRKEQLKSALTAAVEALQQSIV